MPGTFTSLHYHVIFSTKNREPIIAATWRARLHEYLGGMIRGLNGTPICVGGVADHVHLLFGLKKDATNWVKDTLHEPHFAWQEGYAAFTVSPTAMDSVRDYVNGQEEHHRVRTFREELVTMLKKAGVAFEDRYVD